MTKEEIEAMSEKDEIAAIIAQITCDSGHAADAHWIASMLHRNGYRAGGETILGYVNAYRQPDGTIELGNVDLDATLEECEPMADEFTEHVGKCKVVLVEGGSTAMKEWHCILRQKNLEKIADGWGRVFTAQSPNTAASKYCYSPEVGELCDGDVFIVEVEEIVGGRASGKVHRMVVEVYAVMQFDDAEEVHEDEEDELQDWIAARVAEAKPSS